MGTVIANISLQTSAKYGEVKEFSAEQAINALNHFFSGWLGWKGEVKAHQVVEGTLIATLELDAEHANNALNVLAGALKLEVIRYFIDEDQKGYSVGEGEYAEYFLI